jgi:hypothetical protein
MWKGSHHEVNWNASRDSSDLSSSLEKREWDQSKNSNTTQAIGASEGCQWLSGLES